ncbi:MAG TPA: GGDEF domain-containing protein [Pseudomonadales bacterium]
MLPKVHTIQPEPLWKLPASLGDRMRADPSQAQFRQFLFCGIYCAVAVFFLVFYGIAAMLRSELVYAWIIFGFAATTTIGYIAIWLSGVYTLANHFVTFLMGCLCLYLYYTGGTANTGPLYYLVFPMVALFQQGIRAGAFSVAALLVATVVLQSSGMFGFDTDRYDFTFISRLGTVYVIVSVLAFMFAYFRSRAERELALSESDLDQIVYSDVLTGLANQNLMSKLLYTEALRFERYQTPFCLMLVEIDQFQKLHIKHGGDFTNEVMIGLARIFSGILRRQDIAGRWDSNRFVILAPVTSLQGGLILGQRLVDAVANHSFSIGRTHFTITVSVGVTEARAEDVTELINRADELLYTARKLGGNRVLDKVPDSSPDTSLMDFLIQNRKV